MKFTLGVLFCGLLLVVAASAEEFLYEFGSDDDTSITINTSSGTIGLLQYITNVVIPVPPGYTVRYVKVVVNAVSPPKVDYDALYHRVTFKYSWLQLTRSSYTIIVKGSPYIEKSGVTTAEP